MREGKAETFYLHQTTKDKIVNISKQTNLSMSKVVTMAVEKLEKEVDDEKI